MTNVSHSTLSKSGRGNSIENQVWKVIHVLTYKYVYDYKLIMVYKLKYNFTSEEQIKTSTH